MFRLFSIKKIMYRKLLNWLARFVDRWINRFLQLKKHITYIIYMDDFGFDKSDIYIVTYPRSGTTLLQMMLYQITTDGEYDFDHLGDVSPWIKNDVYEGIKANKELAKPRIIKTHDPYKEFDPMVNGKVIFVIRNGLDAMYSLYQQKLSYGNPDLSLEQFSQGKMKNDNGNWFYFNDPWLENKKKKDILYITYNELVKEKENTTKKICDFLNIDFSNVDMKRVLKKTSLEYMKQYQGKFGEREDPDHKNFDYTKFIRSGNSGEGEKEFSTEVKNFYYSNLEKHIKPLLKKRNLEI